MTTSILADLTTLNTTLEGQTAEERVGWALETFCDHLIVSSSFGAQAGVTLHLVTQQAPRLPVVFIDTGYLFPETYHFAKVLTERLRLNLHVYRPQLTNGWLEAHYGKLWEQGEEGLKTYGELVKAEPMRRALEELQAKAWITGLRRQQASSRKQLEVLGEQGGRVKVNPIVDWTDRDVYTYLTRHGLPYHPLWEQGYVSIGDWHSTTKLGEGMTEEETRFGGVKRECGLHDHAPHSASPALGAAGGSV
jgi:phosphoadenosine phosphosulfate reductase